MATYVPVCAVFTVCSRRAASSPDTRYQPQPRQTVLCHHLCDTYRRFFTHGKIVTKKATKTIQFNIHEVDMELFKPENKVIKPPLVSFFFNRPLSPTKK